jgi:release factor glutamine methyltransferase
VPVRIEQALEAGIGMLRGSESARFDALLLLEHQLGRRREWIVAHGEAPLDDLEARRFAESCARRAAGTPVAYLVGEGGFYGRSFLVSDRVLVPRPETEHVVEAALTFLGHLQRSSFEVLDVGTGSGAIACTIAAENDRARVTGVDISPDAVAIAAQNARRLGVAERCAFARGDLTEPVEGRRFDVLVANLPYVPTAQIPTAPDPVGFEPRVALDGGADGLELYRRLLPAAPRLLDSGGLLLLEAAPPQMPALLALVRAAFPDGNPVCRDDYGGRPRFVQLDTGLR